MKTLAEMKQHAAEMATRYDDATTCECGALIECLDGGGYSYWVHVKRMRIDYDHAAVPNLGIKEEQ